MAAVAVHGSVLRATASSLYYAHPPAALYRSGAAMLGAHPTGGAAAAAPFLLTATRLSRSVRSFHATRPISTSPPSKHQRVTLHATYPQSTPQPLTTQRLHRPVAPHMTIWRWQSHMILSALQRNTGLLFSAPLYLFLIAYTLPHLPVLGASLTGPTSAGLVAAAAGLPWVVTATVKGVCAWAFALHAVQGVNNLLTSAVPGWALAAKGRFVSVSVGVFGASTLLAGALLWWAG